MKKKQCLLQRQETFLENVKYQTNAYLIELNRLERKIDLGNKTKRQVESSNQDNAGTVREMAHYVLIMDKELGKLRMQWRDMPDEDQIWKDKVNEAKAEVAQLHAKYDVVTMESLTSSEHTRQLEEFLENEIRKGETLTKEMDKQITWKSQREIQKKDMLEKVFVTESDVRNVLAAIERSKKECDDKTQIVRLNNVLSLSTTFNGDSISNITFSFCPN